jgi:hypothetical protein
MIPSNKKRVEARVFTRAITVSSPPPSFAVLGFELRA